MFCIEMSLTKNSIVASNEEVSILRSEVEELDKFLLGLIEKVGTKGTGISYSSSLQKIETNTCSIQGNNLSTSIAYTVENDNDPDILNVIAFEEVESCELFPTKSIGVQWDLNDINCCSSDELSSFSSSVSLDLSSTVPHYQSDSLTEKVINHSGSLDTISSVDTVCKPQDSATLYDVPAGLPGDSELCPYLKLNSSPFNLFSFDHLAQSTDGYKYFGNRAVSYYGIEPYSYSQITHPPRPFEENPYLLKILSYVEIVLPDLIFNSAMIHYYGDGNAQIPHHSDNEECIEDNSEIVSISLGDSRVMEFMAKTDDTVSHVVLSHGDVLIMSRKSQDRFTHAIPPKFEEGHQGRLSITLRNIKKAYHHTPSSTISTVTDFLSNLAEPSVYPRSTHVEPIMESTEPTQALRGQKTTNIAITKTSDGYQPPLITQPTTMGFQPLSTMNSSPSQRYVPPQSHSNRNIGRYHQVDKWHKPSTTTGNNQQSRWKPFPQTIPKFPKNELHPSRHSERCYPEQHQKTKEDCIFISSSMFRDLDPVKLTSNDLNAHVLYYPGATARQMQSRLSTDERFINLSKRRSISKVILLTGTNNIDLICSNKQRSNGVIEEISKLVDYICELFVGAKVSIVNILPRTDYNRSEVIRDLNNEINLMCKRHWSKRLDFIDTYGTNLFNFRNGRRKSEYFKITHINDYDNVHLNNKGIMKLGAHLKYLTHI